jgi:hypothetical protein
MAAPELSVTVPEMDPVACASRRGAAVKLVSSNTLSRKGVTFPSGRTLFRKPGLNAANPNLIDLNLINQNLIDIDKSPAVELLVSH